MSKTQQADQSYRDEGQQQRFSVRHSACLLPGGYTQIGNVAVAGWCAYRDAADSESSAGSDSETCGDLGCANDLYIAHLDPRTADSGSDFGREVRASKSDFH